MTEPHVAQAEVVCEDLSGDTVVTGEMRYATLDGSDECYANQYWDRNASGSDELSLTCGSWPGATPSGQWTEFGTFAVHEDFSDIDGSDVLFTYRVSRLDSFTCSASESQTCIDQSYADSAVTTWRVNSADVFDVCESDKCYAFAGKMLSIIRESSGLESYESYGEVHTANGCTDDDLGCFMTSTVNCDQIIDF